MYREYGPAKKWPAEDTIFNHEGQEIQITTGTKEDWRTITHQYGVKLRRKQGRRKKDPEANEVPQAVFTH